MGKRERILELVKDGVLSVEEGLDLLENLSEEESGPSEVNESNEVEEEETKNESKRTSDGRDEKRKEGELEAIVKEINQYSVAIDGLNEDIIAVKTELSALDEKLESKKNSQDADYLAEKEKLEKKIISLNKEINLVSLMDDSENQTDIESLDKELSQVLESLYLLENSRGSDEDIDELENRIKNLAQKSEKLSQEKNQKMKDMHSLKMRQWTTKAKQFSDTMDIPKEWREGASKTIDKAGEVIEEGSHNLSGLLREAVKKTKDSFQDIDWENMKVDLSLKEKASFDHEWLFEDTTASILDFKNAKGNIKFKRSINDNIKIEAKVKLFETKEEKSPLEFFEESSVIAIDADHFTFDISNKNIEANLVVYLPERNYDYLRVTSLKGDIRFDELLASDLYIRIAEGDLLFNQLEASMLEVKMSKGDVTIKDALLKDLLVNTVNGDIRMIGDLQSLDLNTIYGDIILTLTGGDLIRLTASSVKGDVKVSLPKDIGFEIEAKTILGKVKSRLTASEKSLEDEEREKIYRFFRMTEGKLCQVKLQTSKGNILLKDR